MNHTLFDFDRTLLALPAGSGAFRHAIRLDFGSAYHHASANEGLSESAKADTRQALVAVLGTFSKKMPSQARKSFDANVEDIKRLLDLHTQAGGSGQGRRYGLEVLNKSAIVLITSYWEAYCEDIAAEGLEHIVNHAPDASVLPKELQKQIAKELEADQNDLAIWSLADGGWRSHLRKRLTDLQEARNRKLNTPKSANIDDLFLRAIGIPKVSDSWRWASKMTVSRSRTKLDKFVTLRGAIAHRGADSKSVKKAQVTDYFDFIQRLAAKTGGKVNTHVTQITGKPLWTTKKRTRRRS